jgi:hypothetical protein
MMLKGAVDLQNVVIGFAYHFGYNTVMLKMLTKPRRRPIRVGP